MRAKFTFYEKEALGIGVYQIVYETNIRMETYPACAMLKEKLEEKVLERLGCTLEASREDKAYSMDFIVPRKRDLGVLLPGENYSVVITCSNCIKRLERSFFIQGDDI